MRLRILSDLHLEFGPVNLPMPDADVVVLGGDVHVGTAGLNCIQKQFSERPVNYVLGNHEFYHQSLPELTETVKRKTDGSNIQLLENSAVELHGFTFLGCTLWADFALRGTPEKSMADAEALTNDFHIILHRQNRQRFRPAEAARLHRESVAWLKNELGRHESARTIVVTHHAPSAQSEAPCHATSPLSPAFDPTLTPSLRLAAFPCGSMIARFTGLKSLPWLETAARRGSNLPAVVPGARSTKESSPKSFASLEGKTLASDVVLDETTKSVRSRRFRAAPPAQARLSDVRRLQLDPILHSFLALDHAPATP